VNKKLARLLQQATRRQAETTLPELFEIFELASGSTLEKISIVNKSLSELGLRLVPDVEHGDIDTSRRVEIADPLHVTEAEVLEDIQRREGEDLELKSSLVYDHNRAKYDPDVKIAQLKSDDVLHSSLKTVAAFLTSSGGVLYVGVDNSGTILGIEYDFPCITPSKEKQNADNWELHLRNCIQGHFKDGENINDYVSCVVIPINGRQVARLDVAPRRKLAFLDVKGSYHLFRRQGNRTVEVSMDLVEEFIETRRAWRA
jgi:Schlafen, AlbA_2